jgi:WD40 repeat protein
MLICLSFAFIATGCTPEEIKPEPTEVIQPTDKLPTDIPPTEEVVQQPTATEESALGIPDELVQFNDASFPSLEKLVGIPVKSVVKMKFSHNGRYLYLQPMPRAEDPKGIVVDLQTGLKVVELDNKGIPQVYFNPNNTSLVTIKDNILREYDLRSGQKIAELESEYRLAALSADGSLLVEIIGVVSVNGPLEFRIVEMGSGKELHRLMKDGTAAGTSFQFNQDGDILAVTSVVRPATITTFFDVESGDVLKTFYDYSSEIAFHPGKPQVALADSDELSISIYDMNTWERERYLGSATSGKSYYNLRYSSNGDYIYALYSGAANFIDLFDPDTGENPNLLYGKIQDPRLIEISPTNDLLASANSVGVLLWGVVP